MKGKSQACVTERSALVRVDDVWLWGCTPGWGSVQFLESHYQQGIKNRRPARERHSLCPQFADIWAADAAPGQQSGEGGQWSATRKNGHVNRMVVSFVWLPGAMIAFALAAGWSSASCCLYGTSMIKFGARTFSMWKSTSQVSSPSSLNSSVFPCSSVWVYIILSSTWSMWKKACLRCWWWRNSLIFQTNSSLDMAIYSLQHAGASWHSKYFLWFHIYLILEDAHLKDALPSLWPTAIAPV